jgi:hypothetical protein
MLQLIQVCTAIFWLSWKVLLTQKKTYSWLVACWWALWAIFLSLFTETYLWTALEMYALFLYMYGYIKRRNGYAGERLQADSIVLYLTIAWMLILLLSGYAHVDQTYQLFAVFSFLAWVLLLAQKNRFWRLCYMAGHITLACLMVSQWLYIVLWYQCINACIAVFSFFKRNKTK